MNHHARNHNKLPIVLSSFLGLVLFCSCGSNLPRIDAAAATTTLNSKIQQQQHQSRQRQQRSLQSSSSSLITDATQSFVASTESTFDHMVELEDNLYFHWNDIQGGDFFSGRLIHISDGIEQAPSWLGMGIYHSSHNYTSLPTENFMIGSTAIIGQADTPETPTPATHYHLQDKFIDAIERVNDAADGGYSDAMIVQHDSDDGTVITDLSFTKTLESTSLVAKLRRQGTNIFIWAVGAPGVGGRLSQHALKGVIYLDFDAVQKQVEGGTTVGAGSGNNGGGSGGGGTTPADDIASGGDTDSGGSGGATTVVNTSPVIRGKCGSSILDGKDTGQVALTPTLNFHWALLGPKIRIALEFTGREAWLGVGTSTNGQMVGSSAVIGDSSTGKVQHYLLKDQTESGVVVDDDSVQLEDTSIASVPSDDGDPSTYVTTLQFTRFLNDFNNDPVPITGGRLNTFLFAVGNEAKLGYHEHRGNFRIDLEECGGTISVQDGNVWTHHGLFATHGFFAVLAWALCTPFAVTVAWFRTLVPASWIYIHVFANVFTFCLTMLTFVMGIMGVTKEDEADHFTHTHHWVGMLLFFVSCFQVINGFLRPPVERKDARPLPPQDTFLGLIAIPRTPRETWQTMHRLSGLTAYIMGIYQIQSGLKLYSQRFQTTPMVKYYWIYVFIFFGSLLALKIWVVVEEGKARQGVMEAVSTQEPTGPGEEDIGGGPGGGGGGMGPPSLSAPSLSLSPPSSQLPLPASSSLPAPPELGTLT